MYIIFGGQAKQLADNFTVLELDTIKFSNQEKVTSYCVVENIPLADFPVLEAYKKVHHDLMEAYRNRNWEYCESAIRGLLGKWNGELDTFYIEMASRVQRLREQELDEAWDGTIQK